LSIRVQQEDFDVGTELQLLRVGKRDIGGVCSFIGLVREIVSLEESDKAICAMTLEHYPGMTERALKKIEAEALERWPLAASLIIHRYGKLKPGDQIVLVATASAHRKAAFEACHYLIDWLKTKAPFWKFEDTAEGGQWVDARNSDNVAAARWGDSDVRKSRASD
tara:strand:- start:535 stop:1029 length:495 start_codon:yes stop_codon:yes gene_type:complete